jgi:hypothetical protein
MRSNSKIRLGLGLAVVVAVAVTLPAIARATTNVAAPTWPIPADAPAGPPPIPALPPAADAPPPADQIANPVTPAAVCGGWYVQSNYGDRWPAGSTWWEYRCSYVDAQYHNSCPGPACNAWCPDCYWEIQEWSDYFFWDGSNAVFYGLAYSDSIIGDGDWSSFSAYWWDGPTAQWYDIGLVSY